VRGRRTEWDRLEARLESLEAVVRRLGARLEDVQGLAARSYEAGLGWPAKLAAVRAQPNYEAAWQEDEPLVTVRIATYNNAEVLCERTLASLRAQTYERWEAIVVGDAVTDDTASRVQALGDPRISFINLPHRGPYPADDERRWLVAGTYPANHAMREARGAWIAPLDHDDEFESDHIEVLLDEARQTHATPRPASCCRTWSASGHPPTASSAFRVPSTTPGCACSSTT
jgi:glycosyl transferase family 2